MIVGIGTDIVDKRRIRALHRKMGDTFVRYILTEKEQAECPAEPLKKVVGYLANRWAIKEAMSKALGLGMGEHVRWKEVETFHTAEGAPQVRLLGTTAATAEKMAGRNYVLHVSVSDDSSSVAFVILEKR